jgi:hypothetical protein
MDSELNYYRYDDPILYDEYSSSNELYLREYEVIKKTDCGVWILFPDKNVWDSKNNKYQLGKKFILEKGMDHFTRKRFAWSTKTEALISYIHRKEYQINILEYKLENAKEFLAKAKEIQNDNSLGN